MPPEPRPPGSPATAVGLRAPSWIATVMAASALACGGGAAGGTSSSGGAPGRAGRGGTPSTGGATTTGGNGSGGAGTGTGGTGANGGRGGATASAGGRGGAMASTGGQGGSGAGGAGGDIVTTFQNGGFWNDIAGNRIEAHGAGFIKVGSVYYWVGEDRSRSGFRGVNLYRSTDLARFELVKAIITPTTAPDLATAGRIIERPKLIYNQTTQTFVLWLHFDGNNYADAEAGVFSSSAIDGDYTFHTAFRPNGNMSRDDTLFADDDGSAYFISAANDNADLIIYQLTADYLAVARQVVTLWPGSFREAPAMFKTSGRYFLISSGATGWDPNQAKYGTATAIGGPWSALQNVGDNIAFDTQAAFVLPVVGSETTTFIYAGDRWMDPNLPSSKYIWLPLTVTGSTLGLSNAATWTLNLTTGRATVP